MLLFILSHTKWVRGKSRERNDEMSSAEARTGGRGKARGGVAKHEGRGEARGGVAKREGAW